MSATVATQAGELSGAEENGIFVFKAIPYAAPPVGDLRFAPPQPVARSSGIRRATEHGPIAPQGKSRLAHVMGDFEQPQSEDCLTLNVWTPSLDGARRPVIVWIHGGAFISGAGSLSWYSGQTFAEKDVVAVTINYRLGALGYLYLPGISSGNMGLLDQVAALQWVQDNISNFGGDPHNVTIVGQSAGGGSVFALMAMRRTQGLFRRAILQSPIYGEVASQTTAGALAVANQFLELLGIEAADALKLKSVPLENLLVAQWKIARQNKKFASVTPPFRLVADGSVVEREISDVVPDSVAATVDVMIGTTREEMAAFFPADPEVRDASEHAVMSVFNELFQAKADERYQETRRRRAAKSPESILGDLFTNYDFKAGVMRFAEKRAGLGRPVYVYQFDWQSPAGLEACHCLEIPFVFDNLPNWINSPMLKGAAPAETAGLSAAMHPAWIAFARTGNPNHPGLPSWPPYREPKCMVMHFDRVIGSMTEMPTSSFVLAPAEERSISTR